MSDLRYAPQHFLYFFPDPQGQGSLRPGIMSLVLGEEGALRPSAEDEIADVLLEG